MLLALAVLSGCATRVVVPNTPLPLPPSIPDLPEERFDCLDDEAFYHVILLRERVKTLEDTIRSQQ